MHALVDDIFEKFGRFYADYDSYKDSENKGIVQRFMEMLATDFDEEFYSIAQSLQENIYLSDTAQEQLLPFIEQMFGGLVKIDDGVVLQRRVIKFANFINQTKGSLQALKTLCRMLNFTDVALDNELREFGFDSDLTLDDPTRLLDSFAQGTDEYVIILYGNVSLNATLLAYLYNLIKWNEPINAKLKKIIYWDIPAINTDLPVYNAMVTNSVFSLESTKLVQKF